MDGKQQLVGLGGVGLIAVNFFLKSGGGAQKGPVLSVVEVPGLAQNQLVQAHKTLIDLALELVAVAVLTVIAGVSDQAANLVLVVLVGLWLAWAMGKYAGFSMATTNAGAVGKAPQLRAVSGQMAG